MRSFSLLAPAKLNLFLHVTGRRGDGYHELQTVFQLLDYGDELSFSERSDGELKLHCTGPQVLDDVPAEDNLVLRAATLLRHAAPVTEQQPGADIQLLKRLPAGGGLGGGSSDAATTLLGLNALWQLGLGVDALAELGRQLGADVPVFVRGHSAWAEGIGERLSPLNLPARWYLVVHPGCEVSTKVIFSHPELTRDTPAITMAAFFEGPTRNDFENLARRLAEPIDKALKWLENYGGGRLTGSGACVYAAFDDETEARAVLRELPDTWQGFVARGIDRSPLLEQLAQMQAPTEWRS